MLQEVARATRVPLPLLDLIGVPRGPEKMTACVASRLGTAWWMDRAGSDLQHLTNPGPGNGSEERTNWDAWDSSEYKTQILFSCGSKMSLVYQVVSSSTALPPSPLPFFCLLFLFPFFPYFLFPILFLFFLLFFLFLSLLLFLLLFFPLLL